MLSYHFSSKNNETSNEGSNEENEGLLEVERKRIKRGRNMIISKISDGASHISEVNTSSDEPEFKRLKSDRLFREEETEECEDEIPEIPDEDEIIDDQLLESGFVGESDNENDSDNDYENENVHIHENEDYTKDYCDNDDDENEDDYEDNTNENYYESYYDDDGDDDDDENYNDECYQDYKDDDDYNESENDDEDYNESENDDDSDDDFEMEDSESRETSLDSNFSMRMKMIEEDNAIKTKDLPERMLLRPNIITDRKLTDEEITEATKIISDNFSEYYGCHRSSKLQAAINKVLKCLSQEFLEVPYIYSYRRYYIADFHKDFSISREILSRQNLWDIYDWEYEYRLLIENRELIQLKLLNRYYDNDDYNEYILNILNSSSSEETLSDLNDYILHVYSKRLAEAAIKDPSTHQHLKDYSFYIECLSKGTHELVKYMGVDVELFSRSLVEENPKLYQVTESEFGPSIAKEFSEFNPKEALTTATKLLSLDIAFDPLFRKYVRQNFIKRSMIIVNPLQEIDESDPCWQFRCSRKHIKKFRNSGIFAEMMSAEKKGQIEIKVVLENECKFFETLKKRIINNSSESNNNNNNNNNNRSWNKYRISAIKQAFNNELRPIMESWIKSRLNKFAERWIMTKTMENFENKLNVCHFRTSKMSRSEISRVAALSWGSGINCNTECVFLDENCNLADYLSFNNLRDNRDMEEFYKVIQFIRKNKPHVIVIRCFDGRTRYLLEIVQEVVDYYKLQGGDHIPVIAINNEVAKLHMSSPRAKKEFPNYNDLTRYCISLARMLQNPIGEYAVLEENIASIIHHPLQCLLSHEKLIECLQRGFINIINEIGVDFNKEMNRENKIDLLQYVSGLGPHKADDLIGKILTNGKNELEKRDHILKNYSMGNIVYTNCAGFIRVQSYRCGPFDNTRIHPRYYALASKMVRDSFDLDEEGDGVINDSCLKLWTRRLTSEPEKINDLVLDDYAKRLSKYHRFTSNLIMHNIKMELVRPYADPRRNFEIPSPEQVYEMEMEETYEMLNTELRDALTFNGNNKHGVTVRESSIQYASPITPPPSTPPPPPPKITSYSSFHQINYKEAIQNLANKSIGSYIIRPSSKGYGFISITWKIYSNIFQHVDIVEKEKYGDSIGKKLEVEGGKYVYSDLKELLKEYLEQKVQTAFDLMIHKRFFSSEEDSRRFIYLFMKTNTSKLAYGFCFDREIPGRFCFIYRMDQTSNIEVLKGSIRPEGYKFSGSVYPTLSHLVKAIKNLIGYKRKPLTAKSYLSFFAEE
ncbi:hypothetical protein Glove_40g65 [Diversispora epigaea]|uniref:Transcription elongation factor SPT6 n=1 Tax=Diversispora epigaea TaxID=1348612 RepID=A0A397JGB5_9GLOM|nr:hypothetical protein Glove_40g65 [Diversispora epigaea]